MQNSNPFKILLIHSPLVSPFVPPLSMARVTGWLSASEIQFELYDANLDFFQSQVMSSDLLRALLRQVEKKEHEGEFGNADPNIESLLSDLKKKPDKWQKIINAADRCHNLFKTDEFFKPDIFGYIINNLKKQFELFSLAYCPYSIQNGKFCDSQWPDIETLRGCLENSNINPFVALCKPELSKKLKDLDVQLVVVSASASSQFLAASTIARFCKKNRPKVHVALIGCDVVPDVVKTKFDSVISEKKPSDLCDLITNLGGSIQPDFSAEPDFSGLPLQKYFLPSLVLPFSVSSVQGAEWMSPDNAASMIKKQADRYGAQRFILENDLLTVTYAYQLGKAVSAKSQGLYLAVRCIQEPWKTKDSDDFSQQTSIKMITWTVSEDKKKNFIKDLLSFSRAGIWNHVEIDADDVLGPDKEIIKLAVSSPNIVHSWGLNLSSKVSFPCLEDNFADVSTPYGKVARLPGKPFWQNLKDHAHKFLYVNEYGIKKNVRMRITENNFQVYTLGESPEYLFVKPSDLPPGYLDEICKMVEAGGSVGTQWVRYNLERAFLIGYVIEAGVIVGNSSLKHPRPEYAKAVIEQSGLDVSQHLERGYTSVRPEYRGMGIGTKLLEGLTARAGDRKIFSVISEDNDATKKIAIRNKTKQVASFYSKRMKKQLGIWMPEWMIEE
jgi:GNAT superfamily N-acetyltransferase